MASVLHRLAAAARGADVAALAGEHVALFRRADLIRGLEATFGRGDD